MPVHTDDGFTFAVTRTHIGDVAQIDRAPCSRGDDEAAEFFHRSKLVDGAHEISLRPFLQPAGRHIDIFRGQAGRQVLKRQVQLGHFALIDFDMYFVFQAAADFDRGHAFNRLQYFPDFLIRVATQNLQ